MSLSLKLATIEDARVLWLWRNEEVTRKASRDTQEVDFDSHVQWLTRCLSDEQRLLYLAELDGRPVGTIRLDSGEQNEVSWTVAPEARRQGLGKKMLSEFIRRHGNLRLVAYAKQNNNSSVRIAESAGFVMTNDDGNWLELTREASKSMDAGY